MSDNTIRNATIEDAEGINAVSAELGYAALTPEACATKLGQLISSPSDHVYVAESDDVIIGWLHLFLALRLASPDFYEIGGLVVDPGYRGQGVGRALVAHAASQHGGTLRVRCNEKRVDSHRFYEAIGFAGIKVQRIFETPA